MSGGVGLIILLCRIAHAWKSPRKNHRYRTLIVQSIPMQFISRLILY